MLLLLIPIAWLALAALVVLLCRMASRSDARLAQASEQRPAQMAPIPTVTLTSRARWHEAPYVAGSRAALAWSPRERGGRTRQGRCVTGS
jgi:hypothetical protein